MRNADKSILQIANDVFLAIQRSAQLQEGAVIAQACLPKIQKIGKEEWKRNFRLCRALIFCFLNPIRAQETLALLRDNLLSHLIMVLCSIGALWRARSLTIWDRRSVASGEKLKPLAILFGSIRIEGQLTQVVDFHDNFG